MPLPLPIMIPFMMWQSAAIAAGFGTYFQYAKRKISALSNDEFNAARPSDLVNELFDDIMNEIPSSFERIRSINNLILQSLADFLEDGIRFLSDKLGGQLNVPFRFEGQPTDDLPDLPEIPIPKLPTIPQAFGEEDTRPPISLPPRQDQQRGPPAPPLTQAQLLAKYANWDTYRKNGGLLTEQQWRVARRGQEGGIPVIPPQRNQPGGPQGPEQGKTFHPKYFLQLKGLQNNKKQLELQVESLQLNIAKQQEKIDKIISDARRSGTSTSRTALSSLQRGIEITQRNLQSLFSQIAVIQKAMVEFIERFKP